MSRRTGIDEIPLEELIDRITKGEIDLFFQIVQRHELSLRSYLAGQIYNLADVDDLAQEVFIAAFRDLKRFKQGEDFSAWLRGIARNRVLMYFRSRQRRAAAEERFHEEFVRLAADEFEAAAESQSAVQIDRLLLCISQLPAKLRKVVHAGLEGAKPAMLAEQLGTSVGAVYQLHYRANQLLRECMTRGEHA